MHLETERLIVRNLKAEDASPLARLWADPQVTAYLGGPRNLAEVTQIFPEDAQDDLPPVMDLWPVVETASGHVIGHCGLLDKEVDGQPEVEVVYVLAVSTWGKGYASEVAAAIKNYAFEQLGLKRVIALIDPQNAASERVAQKIGLQYEKDTVRPGGKVMRVYGVNGG